MTKQEIDDAMKNIFLESLKIYQLEKLFNYQNYGKYPYRDRKKSIQIIADFNADAYSVNGLFVSEENYEKVYQPEVIASIKPLIIFTTVVTIEYSEADGSIKTTIEETRESYNPAVNTEYVEIEDTEVQTIRYLFPFNCAIDLFGNLKLSL